MKYIYFVRYSTGNYNGMCNCIMNSEITTMEDVENIAGIVVSVMPKGTLKRGEKVLIDNYILLRTEGED